MLVCLISNWCNDVSHGGIFSLSPDYAREAVISKVAALHQNPPLEGRPTCSVGFPVFRCKQGCCIYEHCTSTQWRRYLQKYLASSWFDYSTLGMCAANIYAVLPNSNFKSASVWLMYIHNLGAMSPHFTPLLFMYALLKHKCCSAHYSPARITLPFMHACICGLCLYT